MRRQALIAIFALACLAPAPALAQQGTADLRGRVADQQGGTLPGVTIVVGPGTERGNEVLAHAAAMLDLPLAANCVAVSGSEVTRVRWGGSLLEHARVDATVALLDRNAAPGVYHCVNSGATTWHELGQLVAATTGADPALLEPVRVADVRMRAPRPQYCALSNAKLAAAGVPMPTWQNALERHLSAGSR